MTDTVAVFDFDGTITRRDSMAEFLLAAVPTRRLWPAAASLAPAALAFGLGLLDNSTFKERVVTRFFAGTPAPEFEQLALDFAIRRLQRLVRPAALERLHWHLNERHRVVITTASLEAYVGPWARQHGIDDVLGTRLEVDEAGRLTGRLQGRNCYGAEKVARLRALVGDLTGSTVYAYGDSQGDRELMALATYAAYRPFRMPQVAGGSS